MVDARGELLPGTSQILEASAYAPKTLSEADYLRLSIRALTGLHKQQSTHPLVDSFIRDVLPKHTRTDRAVFSIHVSEPKEIFGRTVEQEYILPVRRPKNKSVEKTGKNFHAVDPPELLIKDFPKFIEKMDNFFTTVMTHHHVDRWAQPPSRSSANWVLDALWYHATPHDLQHPEQYVDRMSHHITERPFKNLEYSSVMIPLFSHNHTMEIKNNIAFAGMESPNELSMDFIPENNRAWASAGRLPAVRYGTDGKKAYVYAVQMGKTLTEQDIQEEIQFYHEDALRSQKYFRDIFTRFPENFKKILGDVPEKIMKLESPEEFVVQLFQHLDKKFPKLFMAETNTARWIKKKDSQQFTNWEDFQSSIHARLSTELNYLSQYNGEIMQIPQRLKIPQKRKELMRMLFQLDKGLPNDAEYNAWKQSSDAQKHGIPTTMPEYPEENIFDVPRPAIVSLTTACELFREAGIQELIVPTYFPLRWQDHLMQHGIEESERIQRATTNTLIRLFRRVTTQVEGLEITQHPDEDGFMKVRFTNPDHPLSSTNPLLQDILTGIVEKKIELTGAKEVEE